MTAHRRGRGGRPRRGQRQPLHQQEPVKLTGERRGERLGDRIAHSHHRAVQPPGQLGGQRRISTHHVGIVRAVTFTRCGFAGSRKDLQLTAGDPLAGIA